MVSEFRNCPFCKKEDSSDDCYVERQDFSSCFVQCDNCLARGPVECQESDEEETPGAEAAIRAWNTRTPDLSFLDKAEVVEVAYQALKGEWTYFPTTEDEWKTAIETAIAAIKRMAKEEE